MPINETQIQKDCRIKAAALVRYIKEYNSYCTEVKQDEGKILKAESEGKDEYSIKKMVGDVGAFLPVERSAA